MAGAGPIDDTAENRVDDDGGGGQPVLLVSPPVFLLPSERAFSKLRILQVKPTWLVILTLVT